MGGYQKAYPHLLLQLTEAELGFKVPSVCETAVILKQVGI